MQVRAGGVAVGADVGDVLPSGDGVAGFDMDAVGVHVGVAGGDPLPADGVLDQDEVAVARGWSGERHAAVGGGEDVRPGWGGEVDAGVQLVLASDRVDPHPEAARLDPRPGRERERPPERSPGSVGVVPSTEVDAGEMRHWFSACAAGLRSTPRPSRMQAGPRRMATSPPATTLPIGQSNGLSSIDNRSR